MVEKLGENIRIHISRLITLPWVNYYPAKPTPQKPRPWSISSGINDRPGFCVQNLVQQSYHLFSDMISDHSDYALHPSHS